MKIEFSPSHFSLRRRLLVAVSLVSLIPTTVILNYFFGYYIAWYTVIILIIVIVLGWWIIIEISASIHKIHHRSKETLETIGEKAPSFPDEVKSLEQIIGLLSEKVKVGFEELKEFGYKTEQLNQEVSKKVLILSTILQANEMYSRDNPAGEVVQFLTYHLKNLLSMNIVFCILQSNYTDELKVVSSLGSSFEEVKQFTREKQESIHHIKKMITVDRDNRVPTHLKWAEHIGAKNIILLPVISKGMTIGLVGIGTNSDDFVFQKEDVEVLNLFSQNVTLIWEHERISSKVGDLEMFDDLTGLYNAKTLKKRLEEEIKRGMVYQRPCGLVAVKMQNYKEFQKDFGAIELEKAIKRISKASKTNIRPIDAGGRIAPDTLAIILIEQNKRQSQEVCRQLEENLKKSCSDKIKLDFCVAESPIDGITAEEILSFVQSKLK